MNTGTANSSGAHSEKGPRSLYDSVGRRKTPLPTTALMHMATRPQKPTARTSFSVCAFIDSRNSECRIQNAELEAEQFCILNSPLEAIAPQHMPRQRRSHRPIPQYR